MLTGKQKRFLRAEAHHLNPIFQVGKGSVSENQIQNINEALETKELIKVQVLNNNFEEPKDIGQQLAEGTGAELVQVIGRVIVLYKESKEHKRIELP